MDLCNEFSCDSFPLHIKKELHPQPLAAYLHGWGSTPIDCFSCVMPGCHHRELTEEEHRGRLGGLEHWSWVSPLGIGGK